MTKKQDCIYRVQFASGNTAYDLYARHVYPADMAGFVCVEGFLFHEETELLIDPRAEKLMQEFGDVELCLVPYHHIIRVDKVTRAGVSSSMPTGGGDKVIPMPKLR